jgi:TP901-1 family phage major tail protein
MAKGVDFLIFVNTGTDQTPVYTKVGGQRGGTLNRDRETIDTTSKDNDGWADADYGLGSWSIDGDGLLVEDDTGLQELEDALMDEVVVKVRFQTAAGNKYEGNALVTSLPIEAPYDDTATYSVTLTGKGKPAKVTGA